MLNDLLFHGLAALFLLALSASWYWLHKRLKALEGKKVVTNLAVRPDGVLTFVEEPLLSPPADWPYPFKDHSCSGKPPQGDRYAHE